MLKKNLFANYLGQGWAALMGFIFVPAYIRYLGIDGYGIIGVFAVMQVWFGFLDMGMSVALNRELAKFTAGINSAQYIRNLLRSMEIVAACIGLLIIIFFYLCSDSISIYWSQTSNMPRDVISKSIFIMGLVVAFRIIEGLYRSVLVGLQRQVLYNLITGLMATLRWAGALVVLSFVDNTLTAFFLWQLVSSIVTLIVMTISAYILVPQAPQVGSFSISSLLEIKKFAIGFVGFTILNIVLSQADKLLLIPLVSLSDYGYYMLAAAAASGLNVLTGPVVQAFYPRLSELHAKNSQIEFSKIYHQAAQIISVFFGTAAIILITNSEFILKLWTQDAELAMRVSPLLTLLGLGCLMNGLMWIPLQAQLAIGWTGLMIRINLIALVFYIPLILIIAPRYGAIGVAWVWLVISSLYFVFMIHFMHRKILTSDKWRWYIGDIALPLTASLSITFIFNRIFNLENVSPIIDVVKIGCLSLFALVFSAIAAKQVRKLIFSTLQKFKYGL